MYVTVRYMFRELITEIQGKHDVFKGKHRIKSGLEKRDEQQMIGEIQRRHSVKRQTGVDPEPPVAHSVSGSMLLQG